MKFSSTWLHRWIYYLASGFMFAAAALRALLVFRDAPSFEPVMLLLAAWLLAFTGSLLLAGRSSAFSGLPIGLEMLIILALLLITRTDFFALLFTIPCMQTMQQFTPRAAATLIGLSAALTFPLLLPAYGILHALAITLVLIGGAVLLTAYIQAARRARIIVDRQHALVNDLHEANSQLEAYSRQLEQMASGRERQRLARELHDSVTQTLYSMTLTTQAALLLLDRDPPQVGSQLARLNELTRSALGEMQVLISKLTPEDIAGRGFVSYLGQHLQERRRLDNLSVLLEVEGGEPLPAVEQAGLFRIAQEALNNIVKHAQVSEGVLRLHLSAPFWMEIEDRGVGFDPQTVPFAGGVGLESMCERAAEIGWAFQVESCPGTGTRIRVEREPKEGSGHVTSGR